MMTMKTGPNDARRVVWAISSKFFFFFIRADVYADVYQGHEPFLNTHRAQRWPGCFIMRSYQTCIKLLRKYFFLFIVPRGSYSFIIQP